MKILDKNNNRILIQSEGDFDIRKILTCGQIFRFREVAGAYIVNSLDKVATILQREDQYAILTKDVDYFYSFFALDKSYAEIPTKLAEFKLPPEVIEYGRGIRHLRQDLFEMIISFVISANNNIKRIQMIIENLCTRTGTKCNGYFAFPTLEQFKNTSRDVFLSIGAGYRGEYLYRLSQTLTQDFIDSLPGLDTPECRKKLLGLMGVGPKVADCILLFGLGREVSFPVDTWIEQVYYDIYKGDKKTRAGISKYFADYFGEYSGMAQQYLFYYERENKKLLVK